MSVQIYLSKVVCREWELVLLLLAEVLGLIHEIFKLVLLVLELELLFSKDLLLLVVSGSISKDEGRWLTVVLVVGHEVILQLLCCSFVEFGFLTVLGWRVLALNQIILQPLGVQGLIQYLLNIH